MSTSAPKSDNKRIRRGGIIAGIALLAWAIAALFCTLAPGPAGHANDFFYDAFYRLRPETDMHSADVVLVAADEASLDAVNKRMHFGWPWPRELWGNIAAYVDKAGPRAMAFDIVFKETSQYQSTTGDDDTFSDLLNGLKHPIVFGSGTRPDGTWEPFIPAIKKPIFGAVNVGDDEFYRWYQPTVAGKPSLASAAVKAASETARIPVDKPFRLRFYGPHLRADGRPTFPFIPAVSVLGAQLDGPAAAEKTYGISPAMFKDKIVIFCAIAKGTFDIKSSPVSKEFPGPEVHATAIENMLRGDRVEELPVLWIMLLALIGAFAVTTGVILPRRATFKLLAPVAITAILFAAAIAAFRATNIHWLPPLAPLLAIVIATPLAFSWTYFAEDRQRRFMLKALSKVVSPAVAEQLAREPERLARGTIRTELTLLFTDLANFTDLSEGMDVQQLGEFMNRYLGEMSDQVLAHDGTLDKYIGDAVMCFWNAPLPQKDHALRACRAALAMSAREKALHAEFSALSSKHVFTRIGINTATVAIGFIGSDHLFNYTALGDGVNLASRLEGANKLYGTTIILSANTAALVTESFWLRKLDILRVKGKKEPMAVYELLAERKSGELQSFADLIRQYEAAFQAYTHRDWDTAERLLLELSMQFAQDGPAETLLARVRDYRQNPPEEGWDGVYISSSK